VLARRLAPEGASLPVGAPIAVFIEPGGDAGATAEEAAAAAAGAVAGANVYAPTWPAALRVVEWQSYLKDSKEAPGCSKCMG
jgi:pyruvate/2-oxoglutarate dehydrogenase complex dihydrolipoamide acyltransferase (E2) component